MRIPLTLAIGLVLVLAAVAVTVLRSPLTRVAVNSTAAERPLASLQSNATVCQEGETLPAGTSTIKLWVGSPYGPSIDMQATSQGRVIAHSARGSEWIGPLDMPVTNVPHTIHNVTICFKLGAVTESVTLTGAKAGHASPATDNGAPLPGRMRVEYLRPRSRSWASLAPAIARHMGLGNVSGGAWVAFPLILLMIAMITVASAVLIGELR